MVENRNYALDLLRAIGALAVVTQHMHYDGLPNWATDALFLCARWAVPFFFLASGYFFEKGSRQHLDRQFLKTLKGLLNICVVANLFYFFLAVQTKYYSLSDLLSVKTLLLGDYIHLWFLGSLIFAYLVLWLILSTNQSRLLPMAALLTGAFALLAGPYSVFTRFGIEGDFARFLLSIPFLFTGFLFSRHKLAHRLGKAGSIALATAGLLLQFLEAHFIAGQNSDLRNSPEIFLGTFGLSVGLFAFSFHVNMAKDNILSVIGRNYSLTIYLYHPALVLIIFFIIKRMGWQPPYYLLWFNAFTVFLCTLLLIKLTARLSPRFFKVINGDF